MRFPPFELLEWFEGTAEGYVHLSHSEMLGYRFSEFDRGLPDLDLGEAFPRGSPALRARIAAEHGVEPDDVLVCNGASEANFLVHAALLAPGDHVIAEVPLYPPLVASPIGLEARVTRVPRLSNEGWRLDLDALEASLTDRTRLVVLTNLNNPTSGMLTERDLRGLADLAEAHDFHVHVDETFRELGFDAAPPTASGHGAQFVVTSTLTKAYGLGGLRLGWVAAAPDVLARIKAVKDYTSICPSRISEELGLWVLERKKEFLGRANRILNGNRTILRAWLKEHPEVECVLPDHGNLCFPKFPVDVDRLAERLKHEHKVVIAPGRFFGMGDHARLGYGGRREELARGLDYLSSAIAEETRLSKAR